MITTLVLIVVVMSFNRYEISGLLPLISYPVLIMALAEIPYKPVLKLVLFTMPFVIFIGIFNVLINDNVAFVLGNIHISYGTLSLFSIALKYILTVMSGLILVSTTGITKMAAELIRIKVPHIFVMQLVLVYRYIFVFVEEATKMVRAYLLRSTLHKGIKLKHTGPLIGHLLLRTVDRAERMYGAMGCKGFNGQYNTGHRPRMHGRDYLYIFSWCVFFLWVRLFNISIIIGLFMIGVK